jgi:alpha-tubulin suppressor-like RCC1 family protein
MVQHLLTKPVQPHPWLTHVAGCLMAVVLAACGCSGDAGDPAAPEARATGVAIVTAAAATTIVADDGAQVQIPAAAAFDTFEAAISKDSSGAPPLAEGMAPVGAIYSLTPHGARFKQRVRVTLPLDPATVPAGATVVIARANPGGGWTLLPATVEGNAVSTLTEGFSFYIPVVIGRQGFQLVNPHAEFSLQGQTSILAQGSSILRPPPGCVGFWECVGFGPQDFQVLTQSQIATPISLTMRAAIPAGHWSLASCGAAPVRLVARVLSARVYPDPADSSRLRVNTNYDVLQRVPGNSFGSIVETWVAAYPSEVASMPMTPDGIERSQTFQINLAQYSYAPGQSEPQTGATGLRLFLAFECSPNLSFGAEPVTSDVFTRGPEVVLRRGYPDSLAFSAVPAAVVAVEGESATFRAATNGYISKWQRSFSGAPDLWTDIIDICSPANGCEWQYVLPDVLANIRPDVQTLRKTGLTRAFDNGTRIRAIICPNSGPLADCMPSPPALLTVTQDFVAPQVTLNPVSQLTVRENAQNIVTQFSASFSGLPQPSVSWETKAPGSGTWVAVDPAVYSLSGNTLSTTRSFTLADRGREFRAVGRNAGGSASTFSTALFVTTGLEAPSISAQPRDAAVNAGTHVTMAASVNGSSPMSYQWTFNGIAIAGANSAVLTLNNVNAGNAGLYLLEAGNRENVVRSRAARLTVLQAPIGTTPALLAPAIVTSPSPVSVNLNNTATFAVVASGSAPLRYQWLKNGNVISGATGSVLTLPQVALVDAGAYSVVVTNTAGEVTSVAAALGVAAPSTPPPAAAPAIATQPLGLVVTAGQGATFAVAASGSAPLAYQWQRNGVAIPGGTGPILTIQAAATGDDGQYSVVVSNTAGSATSQLAGLVVTPLPGAPNITAQPFNVSLIEGQAATFYLAVAGNPAPQCLWTRNSAAIVGATSCTGYTTPSTTTADNGAVYNVVVYSPGGVAIGQGAVLTVQALLAPTITRQPQNLTVTEGQNAGFSAAATSNGPLTFQWLRQGNSVAGATDNIYSMGAARVADNGTLVRVRVCTGPQANNLCALSEVATLTVDVAVPTNALTATQIVAGQEWSLVLRPDRSVWGWGRMHRSDGTVQYSNLLAANQALRPVRMYPTVLTDIRAISGWFSAFWALKGEPGTTGSRVLHWGRADAGSDGRGGDGNGSVGGSILPRSNEAAPVEVLERVGNGAQPVDRVCAIAGGGEQLAMIRAISSTGATTDCNAGSAKTVWFVGSLLARGYESTGVAFAMPGLPADSPPAAIFTGQTTSGSPGLVIALEDGRSYGLGANPYGGFGIAATGSGIIGDLAGPALLPASWGSPRSFGMSFYYSLFVVRADGSVMTSGYDSTGELGLGSVVGGSTLGPLPVLAESCTSLPCADVLTGVSAITGTTTGATLALKNGQILAWGGRNSSGLRGAGINANQPFPRSLPSTVTGFTALSASNAHALVIGPGNVVYAWGSGLRGALGDGVDGNTRTEPEMVTTP